MAPSVSELSHKMMCFVSFAHVFFVIIMASYGIGSSASTDSAIPAQSTSKCPFTQTKSFIGRQTAFISNSFSFKSTSPVLTLHNLAPIPVSAASTINSLTALSLPFSIMPDSTIKRNRPRRCTKLQATTIDIVNAEIQVLVKEKRIKKKTVEALEVVVIGLSHHNAGVNVREKLAIPEDQWNTAAAGLCQYDSISEAAVLSTCNRFEIYLSGQNQYECIRDAVSYLEKRADGGLDQATLRRSLFMLSGEDAIWHLLKVGAGLDSLIIGEGQILAQVKSAYDHGLEEDGQSGKVVSRMLNAAVTGGKRVRSETGIAKGAVSISSAAAEFTAMKIRSDCGIQNGLEAANICIIGAGKMARLLLVHLGTQKVQKVTILNRSPDKVIELRKEFPEMTIEFEPMDNMWTVIQNSDVVYPSTSSTTTIIDKEPLMECLKGRTTRPGGIQFIDISVPRNVAADCAEIPGVFSYNVDDLKAVVERNTAKRRREMLEAEIILREELSKYRLWQQSLGAIPTIAKLQEKAENMRLEELLKASKKLSNLSPKDLEAVDRLSKGIIAKLLHGPMNHLRQQGDGDSTRAAIQQLQQAFQLDNK